MALTIGFFGYWTVGLGIMLFMAACILFFIVGTNQQEAREDAAAAWSELAEKTGLEFKQDHSLFFEDLSLKGQYRGRRVCMSKVIRQRSYGEGSIFRVFTRMSLEVNNTGGCNLNVRSKPFLNKVFRFGGKASGNGDFDKRFQFDGKPGKFLWKARQLIVQHLVLLRKPDGVIMLTDTMVLATNWRLPTIQLQGSQLICLQSGVPIHIPSQVEILNLLCDLADLAEGMRSESANETTKKELLK